MNTKGKEKGKKHAFNDYTYLREGENLKNKSTIFEETLSEATKDKSRKEERFIQFRRKGHFLQDCKTGWQAKTPQAFIPMTTTETA